ncbi:hypothetical protein [Microbacterium sp. CFBP9034]|uniref:hypothetical protein n=1 Tax=Microbacterium sp. CFBP9034 TaxID=3096540 RepID=UPI002A6AABFA|nr:hypothetical protein [Microbacterium sp. CFBP9034]MDY0908263.1 hypothetical protein [Microbacterium sp. CFBP9034]
MHIEGTGRIVFYAQWAMALLLPVFFFLGRGAVGAELGWMAIVGIVYGAVVVGLLLIPPVLTLFDTEVRRARATRVRYDLASAVLWLGFVLGGLTVPDSGDSGHLNSALMSWWNITEETSQALFVISAVLVGLAYLAMLVLAVWGIVIGRRAAAAPVPATR